LTRLGHGASAPSSTPLDYSGPVAAVPDMGPDPLDQHGVSTPSNGAAMGLSTRTIGELAIEYETRSYAAYQETGTIESGGLDAWLRDQLARMGVSREHMEFEFKRVMDAVFAV
jgi:hypothetical protein